MKNTSAEHKHSWLGENRRRCPVLPSLASWGPCFCLPPEAPGREVPEQTSLWGSIFGVHSGPVQQVPLCGRAALLRSPSGTQWLAQARTGCIGTTEEMAACGTGWERALGQDFLPLHIRALCPGQLTVTTGQSTYSSGLQGQMFTRVAASSTTHRTNYYFVSFTGSSRRTKKKQMILDKIFRIT